MEEYPMVTVVHAVEPTAERSANYVKTFIFCYYPFQAHCEPPVPSSFATTGRTLAIMLETSYGMGSTIWLMQRNLKAALDSIQTDPTTRGWFTEFILYPFDSSKLTSISFT